MSGTPVHTLHRGEWSLAEARRQLLSIAKELHARGWLANHDGNVTMRMPAGKLLATPTAVSKRVLTEGDLIVVDGDDRVVQGGRKPFSELKMHRAVYAARPDVQVVIHTHAPSATALAIAGKAVEPRMIAEAVVSLGDAIPLIGYGFPNGAEQVAALKAAADRCDAATIENHGVFAWGDDLEMAFLRMELVEHLATIQLRAMQAGALRTIPAADLERLLESRMKAGLGPEARRRKKAQRGS